MPVAPVHESAPADHNSSSERSPWPFSRKLSALLVATVAPLALTAQLLAGPDAATVQYTDAAATDSVRFSAPFQAQAKTVALTGQWAQASDNGTVASSGYSVSPQGQTVAGGACAFGGNGVGCAGTSGRADARSEGTMGSEDWSRDIFTPSVYANVEQAFTTSVVCQSDGALTANQPTGRIRYGNNSWALGGRVGWLYQNVQDVGNGETWSTDIRVVDGRSPRFQGEIIPSWGTDNSARRAWSQVSVRYRGMSSDNDRRWITYAGRSECGLSFNDGSGSTGPRAGSQDYPDTGADTTSGPAGEVIVAAGAPAAVELSFVADWERDGRAFTVGATKEISEPDWLVLGDAVDAALDPNRLTATGEVTGARWTVFGGDGVGSDLPVIEIELNSGGIVQVTPGTGEGAREGFIENPAAGSLLGPAGSGSSEAHW